MPCTNCRCHADANTQPTCSQLLAEANERCELLAHDNLQLRAERDALAHQVVSHEHSLLLAQWEAAKLWNIANGFAVNVRDCIADSNNGRMNAFELSIELRRWFPKAPYTPPSEKADGK